MVKFPVLCNKNINIIYVHVYQSRSSRPVLVFYSKNVKGLKT